MRSPSDTPVSAGPRPSWRSRRSRRRSSSRADTIGHARAAQVGGQAHPADGEAERAGELRRGSRSSRSRSDGPSSQPTTRRPTTSPRWCSGDDALVRSSAGPSAAARRQPSATPQVDGDGVEAQLALRGWRRAPAAGRRRRRRRGGRRPAGRRRADRRGRRRRAGRRAGGSRRRAGSRATAMAPVAATSSHVGPLPPTSRPEPGDEAGVDDDDAAASTAHSMTPVRHAVEARRGVADGVDDARRRRAAARWPAGAAPRRRRAAAPRATRQVEAARGRRPSQADHGAGQQPRRQRVVGCPLRSRHQRTPAARRWPAVAEPRRATRRRASSPRRAPVDGGGHDAATPSDGGRRPPDDARGVAGPPGRRQHAATARAPTSTPAAERARPSRAAVGEPVHGVGRPASSA